MNAINEVHEAAFQRSLARAGALGRLQGAAINVLINYRAGYSLQHSLEELEDALNASSVLDGLSPLSFSVKPPSDTSIGHRAGEV